MPPANKSPAIQPVSPQLLGDVLRMYPGGTVVPGAGGQYLVHGYADAAVPPRAGEYGRYGVSACVITLVGVSGDGTFAAPETTAATETVANTPDTTTMLSNPCVVPGSFEVVPVAGNVKGPISDRHPTYNAPLADPTTGLGVLWATSGQGADVVRVGTINYATGEIVWKREALPANAQAVTRGGSVSVSYLYYSATRDELRSSILRAVPAVARIERLEIYDITDSGATDISWRLYEATYPAGTRRLIAYGDASGVDMATPLILDLNRLSIASPASSGATERNTRTLVITTSSAANHTYLAYLYWRDAGAAY